ncbi:hypothetical protein IAT40_003363 [Kwoniella sp. CBS 6097]
MPERARSTSPRAKAGIDLPISVPSPSRARNHYADTQQSHPKAHIPQDRERYRDVIGRKKDVSDLFPFQEIFLRILSFLSPSELAQIQRVSKYWARMSVDPQLWKRLYLARYPHPHHLRLIYTNPATEVGMTWASPLSSSSAGLRTPRSLRPIARLPSRAFPPPSPKRSPSITEGTLTPTLTPDRRASSVRGDVGRHEGIGHATPLSFRDVPGISDVMQGSGLTRLEGTVAPDEVGHGVRNDGVDWKLMLRLGTNWSNGNALSQSTITLPPSPSPSLTSYSTAVPPLSLSPSITHSHTRDQGQTEQFVALSPSFIFISSPLSPLVRVHTATSHSSSSSSSSSGKSSTPLGIIPPPPGWSSPHRPDNVTAIVADQSVVDLDDANLSDLEGALPARLVVFYQSGGFVLLTISSQSGAVGSGIKWKRESIHPPHIRPHSVKRRATAHQPLQGDPVVLAALHHPILISCTRDFHLSVYAFPSASPPSATTGADIPQPRHLKTLHSEVSFHPAALSLFPASTAEESADALSAQNITQERDEPDHFRAALTYCTPLYPSSWTVAVQELSISQRRGEVRRGEAYHVGRSIGDEDDTIVWPRKIRPVVGVKGKATGVGSDGRWCVLSGEGSQIQVYSLPHHTQRYDHDISENDTALDENGTRFRKRRVLDEEETPQPIVHSQTLLAHSTEITSLALSSGRCVSGGRDGRVLVWELDEDADEVGMGMGAHVHGKDSDIEGRIGRTVGYVEVKAGGRRSTWRGAAGPQHYIVDGKSDDESEIDSDVESVDEREDVSAVGYPSKHRSGHRGKPSLPHPASISSAARSLFLPRPPAGYLGSGSISGSASGSEDVRPAIRHLVFDEEKIVGLVRGGLLNGSNRESVGNAIDVGARVGLGRGEDVMKVWNFSG